MFWYEFKILGRYALNVRLWFRYGFGMFLIWFWLWFGSGKYGFEYDFDMVWCGFDIIFWRFRWVGLKKGNRIRAGAGFWSISPRFLGFDMILIWFCCGFDAILRRCWYDSDMFSSSVRNFDPYQNHSWNHVKIMSA